MKTHGIARFSILPTLALLLAPALAATEEAEARWPSFRGPHAQGVAEGAEPPTHWDGETGQNVLWKTAIPGLGHSSPVVWGDRLFITTAVHEGGDTELEVGLYGDPWSAKDEGKQSYRLYALDAQTGEIVWHRTAYEGVPKIKRHTKSSHANPTPATDGETVVAFFGSEGLYAYDFDGELLWSQDLGVLHSGSYMLPPAQWGFASSPVIHDGRVIVQCDILEGSFLAAFDLETGRELWRTEREEFPTWSSPTIHAGPDTTQVLVNGFKHMGGYDFETGEPLWWLSGGGDVPVPTPVVAHGLVFLTNSHGAKSPIYAVRLSARGDVNLEGDATSSVYVAWSTPRGGAYMQTPIVYGDLLYVCRDNGVLSAYDAKTGERYYQARLGKGMGFTSSAVAAGGKLYFTSEEGQTHVIEAGEVFEELAVNTLGEIVMATPAIAGDELFFRTRFHVVAIGEKEGSAPAPGEESQAGE